LTPEKYSLLYQRIVTHYNLLTILELGTSLGINTLYLSSNPKSKVTTFEGSEEIAAIAEMTFQFYQAENINLVAGDLQYTLADTLQYIRKVDFCLIDANHTYEATTHYFKVLLQRLHDKSVVVIDDIHCNPGMEMAWNEIRQNKLVYTSIDLYKAGILFFDPSLNKQHVILQF
jgi:predicted O-methyltransferase YrrM